MFSKRKIENQLRYELEVARGNHQIYQDKYFSTLRLISELREEIQSLKTKTTPCIGDIVTLLHSTERMTISSIDGHIVTCIRTHPKTDNIEEIRTTLSSLRKV